MKLFCHLCILSMCLVGCAQNNPEIEPETRDNALTILENGIKYEISPLQTRGEDENTVSYLISSTDQEGEMGTFSSIVSSTPISLSYTRLEHLTLNQELICSMVLRDDQIVDISYSLDINDLEELIATDRKLLQCIGNVYRQLGGIIDSDGVASLICDLLDLGGICTVQKALAAAYICARDRNRQ